MMTDTQKVVVYFLSATAGAIAGYLIGEVIVDRIIFGHEENEKGEKEVVLLKEIEPKETKETLDIKNPKPALAELVRQYQPNPAEFDVPPIRVVSMGEARGIMTDPQVETKTVTYYVETDMYVVQNEDDPNDSQVLENPDEVLPSDLDTAFELDGTDVVYCLNEPINTLFTVERVSVSGGVDTSRPKATKTRKRRKLAAKPQLDVAEELSEDDGPKPTGKRN